MIVQNGSERLYVWKGVGTPHEGREEVERGEGG
jgi:hypothetical protein